ncbi:uncharacterized protein A4U43_C07F11860 [Asparagus officinalis]|uniref:MDR-like ABC transporter n=1 Tax=Asparagus officinalis TaxID=4686 RepID=A0A5P1EBF2_ASPOF|nr:uncharacterized protein A4U43_C07F11860 [Asparagus officinalis]
MKKGMVRVRVKDEALVGDSDVSRRKHFSARGGMLDEEERRRLRVFDRKELEKECWLIGMRSWRGGMLELEKEIEKLMGVGEEKDRTSSSAGRMAKENGNGSNEASSRTNSAGKEEDEAKHSVPFYKLLSFADSTDVLLMIAGTIGALANGAALPLMTVLFGNVIQSFGGASDIHEVVHRVNKVCLQFVYLAVGAGIASFFQVSCWMATGERQAARIRNLYLKTILRQEIAFFDTETNTGEVVGRMSGDTVLIQDAMGEKVGKFLQLISSFFGGFIVAFIQGWLLTLVMLTTIPPLVLAGAAMSTVISKMSSKGQTAYADAAVVVEQTIGSIRTVASFTGEKLSVDKYKKSLKKAYDASVQEGIASGLGLGTVMLIMFCGYGLGIWYGSKLILDKGYTGADIINVIFAVLTGSFSLGQASPCITAFAAGQAAAYKMFETINRKPEIDASDPSGKKLDDVRGDIEFKDVYFSYPTRKDEQIFRGFSLFIQSGATVALVGESGSGKSTVVSLVERFYDPDAGEVLIDGINLKEFQLKWIRGKIGLVSQEPVLFASSIRENIAYGKDGATTEEIKAAAELANAAKFIDKMPQGLDTMVGEHGTQLSGGQKQRVAIARAILKDPRILLLDEATSALDAESERIVQEALDRVMANRTTLIVAHRLSTVRNADTIAVIHRGSIVEQGSHSELLKDPDGAYKQLIRLQEMNKNSENTSQSDHDKLNLSSDVGRRSSQHMSLNRSITRESSSSIGNSSRHSFSVPLGLPVGIDFQDNKLEEGNTDISSQEIKEVSLKRLAYLNKPEIPVLAIGSISAIINGTIFPIFGILLSSAINTFYDPPAKMKKDSKFWSLLFCVFGVISFLALPARQYFFGVAGSRLIRRIRLMTFEKVVHMEVGWFDEPENSSGAVGARLSADAATVRGLVGDALALIVQNITTLIVGLVIAFIANWQLSLIILALLPFIGLNGYVQMKFMQGFSADAKVVFALSLSAIGISQTSAAASDSSKATAAAASVFAVLDHKSKIDADDDSMMKLESLNGNIEFRHVSFKYPTRPYVQVFRDLSLSVHSGKTLALVGESGSGKSTAIALLQRFYDPDSGHILIDGIEIEKFQVKWLRQQMGLVSQEPSLFNDTIRANIAYGKGGEATEADIVAAAESSDAHKFICSLQQGYDTSVGERGIQLSGGQKQRVAIARAIVKEPKILLLDEATSALDAESERVVQEALDRVMVNRTTVVIAHRLSTIKGADMIAVVGNGTIIEKGKHETLMNIKDGAYASLVALHSSSAL